jgi:transposase
VFVIGVDPHKGSHTAAVLNATEEVIAECRVDADREQLARLSEWAELFVPRRWAVEGAGGTGALLARQLVAAGEHVVDVPRLCRSGCDCWISLG